MGLDGSIAVIVTYVLTGQSWQYRLLELGYIPEPTPEQVRLFTVLTWVGLAALSVVGTVWLLRLSRGAERQDADRVR